MSIIFNFASNKMLRHMLWRYMQGPISHQARCYVACYDVTCKVQFHIKQDAMSHVMTLHVTSPSLINPMCFNIAWKSALRSTLIALIYRRNMSLIKWETFFDLLEPKFRFFHTHKFPREKHNCNKIPKRFFLLLGLGILQLENLDLVLPKITFFSQIINASKIRFVGKSL